MNIAVCEDNVADADVICGYLWEHFCKNGYIGDIHRFTSGETMLKAFSPGAFDAVFLDIYMGDMTGLEAAREMRKTDPDFALVYITISEDHAREAYTLRACAYVSKPIKPEEMDIAFAQCQTVFLKSAQFIEVISERRLIKIPFVKIIYIDVYNKEILFHTTDGILKTSMPLDQIELKLGRSFLRCHRSYLINMNYIDRIIGPDILMKNSDTVPMRQRSRSNIRREYSNFLTNRLFEAN